MRAGLGSGENNGRRVGALKLHLELPEAASSFHGDERPFGTVTR